MINESPELKRLRRATRIEWNEYRHWINHSGDTIKELQEEAILNDEDDVSPLIKAQYICEMWWSWS